MRSSTVWERPNSRWLSLRQEIFQLFEYDQYPSIVCSSLIGWTAMVSNNLEKDGRGDEEPWVTISTDHLRRCCLGMISLRKVSEAVESIERLGVLKIRPADVIGGRKSYLLDVPLLNKLLRQLPNEDVADPELVPARRRGYESQAISVGKFADAAVGTDADEAVGKFAGDPSASLPSIKDLKSCTEEEEEPPVAPSQEEVFNAMDKLRRKTKGGRIKGEQLEQLQQWLPTAVVDCGPEIVPAFELYLADPFWEQKKFSIYFFISHFQRYWGKLSHPPNGNGKAPRPEPAAAAVTPGDLPSVVEQPALLPALPAPCLEWNRVVVDGEPVERWTVHDRGLEPLLNDPDFIAALPRVLERCQKRLSNPEADSGFMTFRWLLKKSKSTGVPNWYGVLNGEFAWAPKPKSAGRTAAVDAAIAGALAQCGAGEGDELK